MLSQREGVIVATQLILELGVTPSMPGGTGLMGTVSLTITTITIHYFMQHHRAGPSICPGVGGIGTWVQ